MSSLDTVTSSITDRRRQCVCVRVLASQYWASQCVCKRIFGLDRQCVCKTIGLTFSSWHLSTSLPTTVPTISLNFLAAPNQLVFGDFLGKVRNCGCKPSFNSPNHFSGHQLNIFWPSSIGWCYGNLLDKYCWSWSLKATQIQKEPRKSQICAVGKPRTVNHWPIVQDDLKSLPKLK